MLPRLFSIWRAWRRTSSAVVLSESLTSASMKAWLRRASILLLALHGNGKIRGFLDLQSEHIVWITSHKSAVGSLSEIAALVTPEGLQEIEL